MKVFDADGTDLGTYRKAHIPDGPGYQEKFHFSPGRTGFRTFSTRYARIGIGICWDQWFPETARCLALSGAEILLYPTAIGSEPQDRELDSRLHWQRCIQGHAAANMVPVVVANRVGKEVAKSWKGDILFYGTSFIADQVGGVVAEAGKFESEIVMHSFSLDDVRKQRMSWGLFRDRRPDLYGPISTLHGSKE